MHIQALGAVRRMFIGMRMLIKVGMNSQVTGCLLSISSEEGLL